MDRIEKTVFLSYRRSDAFSALAIYQNLTHHGFDVFMDYSGIASGDFEQVIVGNITARAHFLVVLSPSALDRCSEPADWLRREIECALDSQRNIVPLLIEHFKFDAPNVQQQLVGKLGALKSYNALPIPQDYFEEALERLRKRFLNVPLRAVLHPKSIAAERAAIEQKAAVASQVPDKYETAAKLMSERWFESGIGGKDLDQMEHCFSEAIRVRPDFAKAYQSRAIVRRHRGNIAGAIADYQKFLDLSGELARGKRAEVEQLISELTAQRASR